MDKNAKAKIVFIIALFFNSYTAYVVAQSRIFNVQAAYNQKFKPLPSSYQPTKKRTAFILYMSADNDLRAFAYRNLEEIKYAIKTLNNADFHVFIHLDTHNPGQSKKTLQLVAYNGELYSASTLPAMDSGDPNTLIAAYAKANALCPSEYTILGLWNHGTGDLTPLNGRVLNSVKLYNFDPESGYVFLDRNIELFHYLESQPDDQRAICFDDTTHNTLTNAKIGTALQAICQTYRQKPIDVLFCDACLMSSAGFIHETQPWASFLISSQEVILASGFRYDLILSLLTKKDISPREFCEKTVKIFELVYQKITPDYTLSAFKLDALTDFYSHLTNCSTLLLIAIEHQINRSVSNVIKKAANKNNCTSFDEPSYKDFVHFALNMLKELPAIKLSNQAIEQKIKADLAIEFKQCIQAIENARIAHVSGTNLSMAHGLSLYIPETTIHPSFSQNNFAQKTGWLSVLKKK